MTETPTETRPVIPAGQAMGQAVGQAQSVLTRLLTGVLSETGTSRESYLALQRLSVLEGAVDRDSYVRDLSDSLGLDLWTAGELADSMVAAGLLTAADGTIGLADPGMELRARIGDSIGAVSAPVFGPLDAADLETTIRTLRDVTARARAALSAAAGQSADGAA